jgi:hypothetical protein
MKAKNLKIKNTKLPKFCSNCKAKKSDRWHILLLCDSDRMSPRHYLLCESCYPYYDNASSDYKFWIERNMDNYEDCDHYA